MSEERLVSFRTQSILRLLGLLLALGAVLWVLSVSRQVLSWVFVSLFLALALNPPVEKLQRPGGIGRRGTSAAVIYVFALAALVGLGFLLIPPLADQISKFADSAPGYVSDVTHGRGPLGFLQTKYHIKEKVEDLFQHGGGAAKLAG